MAFDGRGPLLGFGEQPQPVNSPLTDFLGQLDSEINTLADGLRAFDFQGPERVELPTLPMPNMTQGIGAILQNIVTPGAAQQFAQQVQQVQRANVEIGLQQAQFQRDSIRNELAKKYGVDFAQFQEMVNLRSELRKEALKAQLGLGSKSEIQLRAQWSAIKDQLSGTSGPQVVGDILSNPESRSVVAFFTGADPSDTEALRKGLESIAGQGEFERGVTRERLSQGQDRIEISKDNYALNVDKFVDARQATVMQASESVMDLLRFNAELDSSIEEAKSKLGADELDKPVKLKTKIQGKEQYTLRELLNMRSATTDMIGGYVTAYPQLAERFRLQGLLGGPSLDIRGGAASPPAAGQGDDETARALNILNSKGL